MDAPRLTRRDFTAALGGIVLSFGLVPKVALVQEPARLPGSLQTNRTLDAWLRINADGSVTVFTGKVELGQGIVTALAQIAAEELEVPLARVTMISGDTGRTPNEGQTAGSQSIEQSGTALRMAGAEVRALLIDLAAKKLGAAADTLKVTDGVINACRTCAFLAWCMAAWCGRHAMAPGSTASTRPGSRPCRESSRWCVMAAFSAWWRGARSRPSMRGLC